MYRSAHLRAINNSAKQRMGGGLCSTLTEFNMHHETRSTRIAISVCARAVLSEN